MAGLPDLRGLRRALSARRPEPFVRAGHGGLCKTLWDRVWRPDDRQHDDRGHRAFAGAPGPALFPPGEGSKKSRAWYALTRIVIDKTDSGHSTFNIPEWGGNALAVAISNAYYPDTRTANDNVQRLLIACGTDAFSNVLKEFWPDVKRHFQKKHNRDAEATSLSSSH